MFVLGCVTSTDLGMQNHNIPDNRITASSVWNHACRAANGRLNFRAGGGRTGSWSSRYSNGHQWLQVDFRRPLKIDGISTQGRQDYNQFVKSYTISFSNDGKTFSSYKPAGILKV